MKHLILQDFNSSYMVYFRPKDKAKLYETLLSAKKVYLNGKYSHPVLIKHIIKCLQLVGFKVIDISQEIKDKIDIHNDITSETIMYRGVLITNTGNSLSFKIGKQFNTTTDFEHAIAIIDKEVE